MQRFLKIRHMFAWVVALAALVGLLALFPLAIPPLVGGLVVLLSTLLFAPMRRRLEQWLSRPHDTACRILTFGLGRAGKTTFLKSALTFARLDRQRSTTNWNIYRAEFPLDLEGSKLVTLYAADYQGQKQSDVTVNADVEFFGPRGNRRTNAVLFLVDLFPELVHGDTPLSDDDLIRVFESSPAAKVDDQVAQNRQYITKFTVEQIFELCYSESNLLAVGLVINKIDLLRRLAEKHGCPVEYHSYEDWARGLYAPLADTIRDACRANGLENTFSVHLVSAKENLGVRNVFEAVLQSYSAKSGK